MLNTVILMGRLTRDPALRKTLNGISVCNFSIAAERPKKEGKKTDFFDIVAWNRKADFVQQYFTKGMSCIVQGHLITEEWQDENHKKHISVKIIAHTVQFGQAKKTQATEKNTADAVTEDLVLVDAEDFEELELLDEVIF